MNNYILSGDGRTPVQETDIVKWGEWFQTANRTVAKTDFEQCRVSTVFLGIDHNWGGGPPLLFETMIFGGINDEHTMRCSTWDQAVAQHEDACAMVHEDRECD